MSHFTVLVIGEDVEGQLAPFDENLEVNPYVIHNKRNAAKELAAEVQKYYEYTHGKNKKNYNQVSCKEQLKKYQKMTPEEYWQQLVKYEDKDNVRNGCIYSTYNPQSKWDWYSMGGRWMGFFKAKIGASGDIGNPGVFDNEAKPNHFDSMLKKDIDFEGMKEESIAERKRLWIEAQEKIKNGETGVDFLYGIEDGDTEETYVDRGKAAGQTFAILMKGKWYEKETMGWWGCTSNRQMTDEEWVEKYGKLIDSLDGDTRLTVVDCHI
jgi:hypothetical protein